MFRQIYKKKKVLITGNTGFKGSWLTAWLTKLGAKIIGVSKNIPTNPSIFEELKLEGQIKHYKEDIRDLSKMIDSQVQIIFNFRIFFIRFNIKKIVIYFYVNSIISFNFFF